MKGQGTNTVLLYISYCAYIKIFSADKKARYGKMNSILFISQYGAH